MTADSFLSEIQQQPRVIATLTRSFEGNLTTALSDVRRLLTEQRIRDVVITGMGGSLYSAYGATLELARTLRIPVSIWDTSELVQQIPEAIRPDTLLIVVSQSGESVEIVRLTEAIERPKYVIGVTNEGGNSLSRWADLSIATKAGAEATVSTKTYTGGMAALFLIGSILDGRYQAACREIAEIPHCIEQLLSWDSTVFEQLVEFLGHQGPISFIGRGASFSSAAMSTLLCQEAAKLNAVAFTGGQFRHGPIEIVRSGFRSVVFAGDERTAPLTLRLVEAIRRLGGSCVLVCAEQVEAAEDAQTRVVRLPKVASRLLPILEIIPLQLLMLPLAKARGFVPNEFLNARKVTTDE